MAAKLSETHELLFRNIFREIMELSKDEDKTNELLLSLIMELKAQICDKV